MRYLLLDLLFLVWLVASAINQFSWPWWKRVAGFDLFGLLPYWTFFAPRPGTDDTRLVYRDVMDDGSRGGWIEVATICESSPLLRMLWHPAKLDNKALSDLVQMLATEVQARDTKPAAMLISLPYVQLLEAVMRAPREERVTARQFALLRTHGERPPRETSVIVVSQPHGFQVTC